MSLRAISRNHVPTQTPSTRTAWWTVSTFPRSGTSSQHHADRRRKNRPDAVPSVSAWVLLPTIQFTNRRSCSRRATSGRRLVDDAPHDGHRHRCVPADVRPFFTSSDPHTRQVVEFVGRSTTKGRGPYRSPFHREITRLNDHLIHTFWPITRVGANTVVGLGWLRTRKLEGRPRYPPLGMLASTFEPLV